MYTHHHDLMLYLRFGTLPPGDRAGPVPARYRVRPVGRGSVVTLLVRMLASPGRLFAAVSRARARSRQAGVRERYLEMEFAVGFAPEDEPYG
jgi:hypothetical protein